MANGNQGLDFNQFLSTLISSSQANERLKVQKDALALQEMSTMSQSEYRDYLIESDKADARRKDFQLEATALAPYPELQKDWLKNRLFPNDPETRARLDATFKARTELDDRINAASAMPPGPRTEEYRKIKLDKNLDKDQRDYIDKRLVVTMEEGTLTLEEMKSQPAYTYYLQAQNHFIAISDAGRRTDVTGNYIETEDEFQERRGDALDIMFSYEDKVREQELTGRGPYVEEVTTDSGLSIPLVPEVTIPFYKEYPLNQQIYGDIEGVPESISIVDRLLGGLGATVIESDVLPPEFAPLIDEIKAPSVYTGQDKQQKQDVDFYYELLKDGKISKKRFWEAVQKKGVNIQSIDVGMMYKVKGKIEKKVVKKELSVLEETNISHLLRRIEKINETKYAQEEKQKRIDKIKEQILAIDPNYKFKN